MNGDETEINPIISCQMRAGHERAAELAEARSVPARVKRGSRGTLPPGAYTTRTRFLRKGKEMGGKSCGKLPENGATRSLAAAAYGNGIDEATPKYEGALPVLLRSTECEAVHDNAQSDTPMDGGTGRTGLSEVLHTAAVDLDTIESLAEAILDVIAELKAYMSID